MPCLAWCVYDLAQLDGAESSLQQSKLEVKNLNQAADKNQQERIAKVSTCIVMNFLVA